MHRPSTGLHGKNHSTRNAFGEGPPTLLFDRRKHPRTAATPRTVMRLHDYDLRGFADVAPCRVATTTAPKG